MEELLDVRDEAGKPTGHVLSRDAVHAQGLWHGIVFVWVYNGKGEILLQYRSHQRPTFGNQWDVSAGGHMGAGETPVLAATRELSEELGITAAEDELTFLTQTIDRYADHLKHIHQDHVWVYLLKKDIDITRLALQTEEVLKVQWISLEQLVADIMDTDKSKLYAGRNKRIYQVAIDAVRANMGQRA